MTKELPVTARIEKTNLLLKNSGFVFSFMLFLFFLLLFVLGLPKFYTGDDLQYAMTIERAVDNTIFYHPEGTMSFPATSDEVDRPVLPGALPVNLRYILEYPTSILYYSIWKIFGWKGGALIPIQTLRAIAGSLGLVAFFKAIIRITSNRIHALLATFGLGTSFAYWTFSTSVDQSIIMIALATWGFSVLINIIIKGRVETKDYLSMIFITGTAGLYNLTVVFTYLLFAVAAAFFVSKATFPGRVKFFLKNNFIFTVFFLLVILFLIYLSGELGNITQASYWQMATFQGHPEYNLEIPHDLLRAVLGFAKSQVVYPPAAGGLQEYWDLSHTLARLVMVSFLALVLLFLSIPLVPLFFLFKKLTKEERFVVLVAAGWLAVYTLFNIFWDPGFIKYWLLPLVAWWALIGVSVSALKREQPDRYRFFQWTASLLVIGGFCLNYMTVFLPGSNLKSKPWWAMAQAVEMHSTPDDLFISTRQPVDFYVSYLTRRDIVSTDLVLYGSGGDQKVLADVLQRHIWQHQEVGGKVYIYSDQPLDKNALIAISPALEGYSLGLKWNYEKFMVYELTQ